MYKEVILTEDGSHTLRVEEIDECYHSTHGAAQESMHIFIDAGLRMFLSDGSREVNILEIGFGTGLNAYLTLIEAGKLGVQIHYTALELYPLSVNDAMRLNYPEYLGSDRAIFEKIHHLSWNKDNDVTPYFSLNKINCDYTNYELSGLYDVVYFDAFSPEKQPEMWSEDCFRKIYGCAGDGAVITTYCAKGAVRRAMGVAGFLMERLPGPPGKREILRGRKIIHKADKS